MLLWLPFEDQDVRLVLLFAAALCALAAGALIARFDLTVPSRHYLLPFLGALTGVAVPPVGVPVMALKSGLHGHSVADFHPSQVIDVLGRTPVWAGIGLLVGLAITLWLAYGKRRG